MQPRGLSPQRNSSPISISKDLTNISAQSGTTGVLSTSNINEQRSRKKKHAVFIKDLYLVRECIYKGQYHNTYKGVHKQTKQQLMIKMCNQFHEHITSESKIYKMVKDVSCVPRVIYTGEDKINGTTYFIKVIESQGPSLKILYSLMGNYLSIQTICTFAINMLTVIEELHKANIVHRNIRPRKIVTHSDLKDTSLLLLDLKYASKFRHKNGQNVSYNENNRLLNKGFLGKFSSVGTHLGISPSRKDDMESLAYILIFFFRRGRLFQTNHKFKTREEKLRFYEEAKLSLVPETLSSEMPQEVISFISYVRAMNLQDPPSYELWRKNFKKLLAKFPAQECAYDWIPRIRQEMSQYSGNGNSFLQDLDNPSEREPAKDSANRPPGKVMFTQQETDDKLGTGGNITLTTAASRGRAGSTMQQEDPSNFTAAKHSTREMHLDPITEVDNNVSYQDESACYGAVDVNEVSQRASNVTFGVVPTAGSELGTSQHNKTNNNNNNNYNNINNNNSVLLQSNSLPEVPIVDGQYSVTGANKQRSKPSEFDIILGADADEDYNGGDEKSLSMQIYRHNRLYVTKPFAFKAAMKSRGYLEEWG